MSTITSDAAPVDTKRPSAPPFGDKWEEPETLPRLYGPTIKTSGAPLSWAGSYTDDTPPFMTLVRGIIEFTDHVTGSRDQLASSNWALEPIPMPRYLELIEDLTLQLVRLQELAQLSPDWDEEGAMAPSAVALMKAAGMVITAATSTLHAPVFIAPLPDGSLQVEWTDESKRLELVIDVDGSLSADLIIDIDGPEPRYEAYDSVDESKVLGIVSLFAS